MSKETAFSDDSKLLAASHSTLILKHLNALKNVLDCEDSYIDFLIEKHNNVVKSYENYNFISVSFSQSQLANCRNGYRRSILSKYSNAIDIKKFIASENFEKSHIYFTKKYPNYQTSKLGRELHEMLVNEVISEYIEFLKKTHPSHILKQATDEDRYLRMVKPVDTENCDMCKHIFLSKEIQKCKYSFEGEKIMFVCEDCNEVKRKEYRKIQCSILTNF